MTECVHGMDVSWCGDCRRDKATTRPNSPGAFGSGETKQDVLNRIADLLGIERQSVGAGSSLPAGLFVEMANRLGMDRMSMPATAEAIVKRAELPWLDAFDSRGTISGGGSTVTKEGLDQLEKALARLL